MRREDVQIWLDRYIAAWSSYDQTAIGELFADEAEYRYQPWADPVVGRSAIVADWLANKDEPGTWAAHYDVWSFDGERADAIGESRYTNPDGSFRGDSAAHYPVGQTALALYALAKSQVTDADPVVPKAVAFVKDRPIVKTYEAAAAILALDALKDPAHDEWIRGAARWLEEHVHAKDGVWAYPVGGGAPVFVGVAGVGGARPDVATLYGGPFVGAGFTLSGTLAPSTYDLTVYAHSAATNSFAGAQTVRVIVR